MGQRPKTSAAAGLNNQKRKEEDSMIIKINYSFPQGYLFEEYIEPDIDDKYMVDIIKDALAKGAKSVSICCSKIENIKHDYYEMGKDDGANEGVDDFIEELSTMSEDERNTYIKKEIEALKAPEAPCDPETDSESDPDDPEPYELSEEDHIRHLLFLGKRILEELKELKAGNKLIREEPCEPEFENPEGYLFEQCPEMLERCYYNAQTVLTQRLLQLIKERENIPEE